MDRQKQYQFEGEKNNAKRKKKRLWTSRACNISCVKLFQLFLFCWFLANFCKFVLWWLKMAWFFVFLFFLMAILRMTHFVCNCTWLIRSQLPGPFIPVRRHTNLLYELKKKKHKKYEGFVISGLSWLYLRLRTLGMWPDPKLACIPSKCSAAFG